MPITKIVQNGGVTLKCSVTVSSDSNPWIVCIMPFGFELELALPLIDGLSNNFNVVTWESRLILEPPERDVSGQDLTIQQHVSDLSAIVTALELKRFHLLGYCSGAGIALAAAQQLSSHISRLVLCNGEYTPLDERSFMTQFGNDIDSLLSIASSDRASAEFILEKMNFDDPESGADTGFMRTVRLPFSEAHYFHRYAENYINYRQGDFVTWAKNVSADTLVMCGEKDLQTSVESSRRIQGALANSRLVVDPEGDHYEILRSESRLMNEVKGFLLEQIAA